MATWFRVLASVWLAVRRMKLAAEVFRSNLLRGVVAVVAAGLLAACGGGSSDPAPLASDGLNLVGTAGSEAAMSGAAVSVKCASGPAQTITAADGTFSVTVPTGTLPCMIEVSGGGRVFRSIVVGTSAGTYRINANPLTELAIARIASDIGSTPQALFSAFGPSSATITAATVESAVAYLRAAFSAWVDLAGLDPLSDLVVMADSTSPANTLGSKVSAFAAQVAAANTTLDNLVAAILDSQVRNAPLMPRLSVQPVSSSVESPQAATFFVQATGILAPQYQWQMSVDGGATFVDLVGAVEAGYTVPATQTTDSGKLFRVRVFNAAGSVTSIAASLAVAAPPPAAPAITVQPQSTSVPYGQAATFTVGAQSALPVSYQWSRNGVPISGATANSFTIPLTVPGDNGASFAVAVTNTNGSNTSASATLTVTNIPASTPPRVAAGASHTAIVRNDGSVLSWGNIKADIGTSLSGLMGVGNDVVVPGAHTVAKYANGSLFTGAQAIVGGQWCTLVLKIDGSVWGWGYAGWGNLGTTAYAFEQRSPVQVKKADGSALTSVVQLAAGIYSTSMAVASDGTVWGWGQNRYGQLGIGSASETGQQSAVPMLAPSGVVRFADAVQVAPGISHALILKRDGSVYAVGWGDYGALGDGATTNRPTLPTRVELSPGVPLSNIVSISAGGNFSVAVTAEGTVYAWGYNSSGQLGDGTRTLRTRPVLVHDDSGRALNGVVAAAAGIDFTVFLKSDGSVWAVGNNAVGQLGTNSAARTVTTPEIVREESGAAFGDVVGLYLLSGHTVVRRRDGTLWAWGDNTYLQLGDQTSVTRRNPVRVQ